MTDSNQILKVEHISDNSYANRSKDEPSLLVGHRTGLDTNRAEPRACPRSVSSSSSDWSSESGEEFEGTALVSTRHRTPSKVKAIQVAGSGKEEGLNEPVNEPACHSGEGREGGHKIEEKQPENGNATKNSNRFRQKCSSCGVDISSLHYLEQVKHAKQCMSRRKAHGEGGSNAGSNGGSKCQNGPRLLDKDIRDWLKELELEPYIDRFLAEEIDISIVHVLDEADLNSLGIVDRILQIRFMQAAKLVGKERERNKKIKETKAGLYRPQTRIASPRLKQQKLRLEKVGVLPLNDNISHSPRSKRVEEEHSLLSVLYPIAPLREGQSQNPPSDAQAKAQVPLKVHNYKSCCVVDKSVSLFTAAALCRQVTVPLEDRLENRRVAKSNGDSENGGNGSNHQETLERGGIRYHAVHEDRATKVLKLQALQQELAAHESTVVVLKTVISQLQMELDAGE